MGKNSKIQWCDHTFNPWVGCTKVSPGCDNCYAESMITRFGKDCWGAGKPRERTSAKNWAQPVKWNAEAKATGIRPRVFCGSLCDWLDDEVPIEWLSDLLKLIQNTPHLDWLMLTKRPGMFGDRISKVVDRFDYDFAALWLFAKRHAPLNVWIGTTVENQEQADKRIPELLKIPARVRFLSCEPLLGAINLLPTGALGCDCPQIELETGEIEERCSGRCNFYLNAIDKSQRISWAICGGESGSKARPMHPDWARSLRDQCNAAGVPFFFKQWGEWAPSPDGGIPDNLPQGSGYYFDDPPYLGKVWHFGTKASGCELDGRTWDEFPGSEVNHV